MSDDRITDNFNRAAARYDAHADFQHGVLLAALDEAIAILPEHGTLLDIGCGTGLFSSLAKQKRPGWHITGIDKAPAMCELAAKRCDRVECADATALPFNRDVFDAAFSSLCMQWVENRTKAFAEMSRVLKPGGKAVVATLGEETLKELHHVAQELGYPQGLLAMRSLADYRRYARDAGFIIRHESVKTEVKEYPHVAALLASMRGVGAGNAKPAKANYFGKEKRQQLESAYRAAYGDARGVRASWQTIILSLEKP